ncbi:unnamed protein product [Effrenium voratum]|nr:unnamed protein product [Effrenium voratum]
MASTGATAPTPGPVLARLVKAFGQDKVGETGYDLAATRCCTEAEKSEARKRGSSLLYGEMLPDGVSKALQLTHLGPALQVHSSVGCTCQKLLLKPSYPQHPHIVRPVIQHRQVVKVKYLSPAHRLTM